MLVAHLINPSIQNDRSEWDLVVDCSIYGIDSLRVQKSYPTEYTQEQISEDVEQTVASYLAQQMESPPSVLSLNIQFDYPVN